MWLLIKRTPNARELLTITNDSILLLAEDAGRLRTLVDWFSSVVGLRMLIGSGIESRADRADRRDSVAIESGLPRPESLDGRLGGIEVAGADATDFIERRRDVAVYSEAGGDSNRSPCEIISSSDLWLADPGDMPTSLSAILLGGSDGGLEEETIEGRRTGLPPPLELRALVI
jgi:hypothetical protein